MATFVGSETGFTVLEGGEVLRVDAWGESGVRVRSTLGGSVSETPGSALGEAGATDAGVEIEGDRARMRNGDLVVEVYDNHEERFVGFPPLVRFLRADGEELFAESVPHFTSPPQRRYRRGGGDLFGCEVTFDAYAAERFYGLGQHQHGLLDQKGAVIDLVQRNTEVSVPFALSSRGYGFLWNMPGVGRVELGANRTRWAADAARQIDYWVTTGPTPAEIVSRYARVTGLPPMLPEWASGFWQCKLRYRDPGGAARGRARVQAPRPSSFGDRLRLLPLDAPGRVELRPGGVAGSAGDGGRAARARGRADGLGLADGQPQQRQLRRDGPARLSGRKQRRACRFIWRSGTRAPTARPSCASTTRPTPTLAAIVWEKIVEGYRRYGIRAFWLDACEPEILADNAEGARYFIGQGSEVQGIYPREHARGFYEGLRASGEDEVVLLCRSAWAGSQRYGAAVWSGDIESTFEALAAQIPAGLNIGISGDPLVDDRHRRVPKRRPDHRLLPRARRALVPVRRLLPALQAARRPRARPPRRLGPDRGPQRSVVLRRRGLPADPPTARIARTDPPVRHGTDGHGQRHRASRPCARSSSSSRRRQQRGR